MTSRALRMIYRQIPPTSPCRVGCTDCCGPVPWSAEEFARVRADLPPTAAVAMFGEIVTVVNPATGKCAFVGAGGCTVHDRRPIMCRLFGAVAGAPLLRCPHGVAAKRPLSAAQAFALTGQHERLPPLTVAAVGAPQAADEPSPPQPGADP